MHSGKTRHGHGDMKPLRDRLTDDQLRQRAAKTEVRRLLSLEHARTRGIAIQAFNNTVYLRKAFIRVGIAACIALVGLSVVVGYVWAAVHYSGR